MGLVDRSSPFGLTLLGSSGKAGNQAVKGGIASQRGSASCPLEVHSIELEGVWGYGKPDWKAESHSARHCRKEHADHKACRFPL
jgi:hypothetical protein